MNEQRTIWERYVASWKTVSAGERSKLFESCLARDCTYTDPLTQARGWDALVAYMDEFHRQIPGGHFVTEYFLAHHGKSIARWKMLNGEAVRIGEGISYAEYGEDNKLIAMTGFFDAPGS